MHSVCAAPGIFGPRDLQRGRGHQPAEDGQGARLACPQGQSAAQQLPPARPVLLTVCEGLRHHRRAPERPHAESPGIHLVT